jgi:hypothetical protein
MIRFIYFRENKDNSNHNGIVCAGYQYKKEDKSLDIGVSFCNPVDRFSRKRAHAIIKGRLENNTKITIKDIKERPKYSDVVNYVVEMMVDALSVLHFELGSTNTLKDMVAKGIDEKTYPKVAGVKIPIWLPNSIKKAES